MSHYVHQVPGRLRIRSRAFNCNPSKVRQVESRLKETEGVLDVRHNSRNGSLTIQYDPASGAEPLVLGALTEAGCLPLAKRATPPGSHITAAFGKAVVTALAQQTVARSFTSLATILR